MSGKRRGLTRCPGKAQPCAGRRRNLLSVHSGRARGFSFAEILVAVAILAIAAAVALPSTPVADDQQLELAAAELADSYRFARDEARRTRVPHGVTIESDTAVIRVFRIDSSGPTPVYDVLDPITRRKFWRELGGTTAASVSVGFLAGERLGVCSDVKSLVFDMHGAVRCASPLATWFRNASIIVRSGDLQRAIVLDGYSGRVVVQ